MSDDRAIISNLIQDNSPEARGMLVAFTEFLLLSKEDEWKKEQRIRDQKNREQREKDREEYKELEQTFDQILSV